MEGAYEELRGALADKEKAERQVTVLEEQLEGFDAVCAENTELRSHLSNVTAIRLLRSADGDGVSAPPDEAQEFTDLTPAAWRARA